MPVETSTGIFILYTRRQDPAEKFLPTQYLVLPPSDASSPESVCPRCLYRIALLRKIKKTLGL